MECVDVMEPAEAAMAGIGSAATQPSNNTEIFRKLMINPQRWKQAAHKTTGASQELSITVKSRTYTVTLAGAAPQMVLLASIVKYFVTIEARPVAGAFTTKLRVMSREEPRGPKHDDFSRNQLKSKS